MERIFALRINRNMLILSGIVLLALLVKLGFFFCFYHSEYGQITQQDSGTYLAPAKSLLAVGQYWAGTKYSPMFMRTPGYPTFIAMIFFLFGHKLVAIILAQCVLASLMPLMAYAIAKRLFNSTVALFAAAMVALDYLLLSYSVMVLSDLLSAFLLGLVFLVGVYLFSGAKQKLVLAFLLGLMLALVTLVRPMNYYLIIPVLIGAVSYFAINRSSWGKIGLLTLLILLPSVILVGSWQLRNKMIFGTYTYSNIAGYNLFRKFAGNIIQKEHHLGEQQAIHYLEAKIKNFYQLSRAEQNRQMVRVAFQVYREHPWDLLTQAAIGLPKLLFGPDTTFLRFFAGESQYQSLSKFKTQLNHLQVLPVLKQASLYQKFLLAIIAAFFCLMLMIIFFTVFGIYHLQQSFYKNKFAHLYLIGCLLYFIGLSSNAVSYGRFRVPFQLLLDLYASYGVVYAYQMLQAWKTRRESRAIETSEQLAG